MVQMSVSLKADEERQDLILDLEGWQRALIPLSRSGSSDGGMGPALARDLLTLLMCKIMETTAGYDAWLVCVSCSLKVGRYLYIYVCMGRVC